MAETVNLKIRNTQTSNSMRSTGIVEHLTAQIQVLTREEKIALKQWLDLEVRGNIDSVYLNFDTAVSTVLTTGRDSVTDLGVFDHSLED